MTKQEFVDELGRLLIGAQSPLDAIATVTKVMQNLGEMPMQDVRDFHEKYKLAPQGHVLTREMQLFRLRAMLEEFLEYCEAVGYKPTGLFPENSDSCKEVTFASVDGKGEAAAFDALIDSVYFTLGTAYMHNFPFEKGWRLVQAANMQKVRAERNSDSKRESTFDVVKPSGWQAPNLEHLLKGVTSAL